MTNGRKFYEKQPRDFPYGILPYAQPFYWVLKDDPYCENDSSS